MSLVKYKIDEKIEKKKRRSGSSSITTAKKKYYAVWQAGHKIHNKIYESWDQVSVLKANVFKSFKTRSP